MNPTPMPDAAESFAVSMLQLEPIAALNREALRTSLSLDQSDPQCAEMTAGAIAMGIASLALLRGRLLIAAIDMEMEAAAGVSSAGQ